MGMAQGESRCLPLRHEAVALPSEEPGCRVAHGWWPLSRREPGGRGLGASGMSALGGYRVCCQSASVFSVFFSVSRPGVYRPYPWAHLLAEFAAVVVLRCEAVLAA